MSGDERDEGFLARWSRRKRASGTATPADPPPQAKPVAAATPAAPPPQAPPEPVPELPPIDSLTSASDFTPFLGQGVAPALRNAALRKLWNDPAIRDAIGPARDYAWDWNAPGGVPGGGPAPSADEIQQFLARLRGGPDESEPAAAREPAQAAPPAPEPAPAPPENSLISQQTAPAAATPGEAPPDDGPPPRRRRHGGATPV